MKPTNSLNDAFENPHCVLPCTWSDPHLVGQFYPALGRTRTW